MTTPLNRVRTAIGCVLAAGMFAGNPAPCAAAGFDAPPGAAEAAKEADELATEIDGLNEDDARAVFALGRKLIDADGDAGFRALQEKWGTIESPTVRAGLMTAFVGKRLSSEVDDDERKDRVHPRLVDVLDLGVRDANAAVQAAALKALRRVALTDFAERFEAYYPWYEGAFGRDANEVLEESVKGFVERARGVSGDGARALAEFVGESGDLMAETGVGRRAATRAGWLEVVNGWLDGDEATAQAGMRIIGNMRLRRPELEKVILPRARDGKTGAVRTWAVAMLGDARARWALDELLLLLRESYARPEELRLILPSMCRALAAIGDASAIPVLIGAMEAEGTRAGVNTVAGQGLAPLTGVKQREGQDAAWWRDWWQKNRARFPEPVRSMEVPATGREAKKDEAKPAEERDTGGDVAGVPSADVRAGFDNDKRYFLIGLGRENPQPEGGYKVLVMLPGGDGGAAFNPFARRVWKGALGPGWLLAQLVAPRWEAGQFDRLVWPTERVPYKGAEKSNKFTTEEFADAVLADVKGRVKVDPAGVYLFGWSSGGPAVYAAMLRERTPFVGAMVAMSVFKPEQTAGLQNAGLPGGLGAAGAAGAVGGPRRFYLLQSPQDTVTAMSWAKSAREGLEKSGARVTLKEYPGGHGWRGDGVEQIKRGVEWLMGGGGGGEGAKGEKGKEVKEKGESGKEGAVPAGEKEEGEG